MFALFILFEFMSKKHIFLFGLVVVMAGVYVVLFTSWFKTRSIGIFSTQLGARINARTGARMTARAGAAAASANFLTFGLDDYYELTEIKVVSLAALQTNALAEPVWHLVGDPSSDSINSFVYGERIEGMSSAVPGLQPEPLQPGVIYRLFVTDGKLKGQHDFHLGAAPANTSTNKSPPH